MSAARTTRVGLATLVVTLGVPVVVFSNFPALTPDEPTYDALLRRNLDALLSEAPPRP